MQAIEQSTETAPLNGSQIKARSAARKTYPAFPPIPSRPTRWFAQRKAEILTAVRRGSLTLDQACTLYDLSVEEFMTWHLGEVLHGMAGLRATTAARCKKIGVFSDAAAGTARAGSKYSPG